MSFSETSSWPILTRYEQDYLPRIALPLGGIGTGTVSLGGWGDLRDWEIVNRPAKGFTPHSVGRRRRDNPRAGRANRRVRV
jgi:non-lysosomal glucosylceramidase